MGDERCGDAVGVVEKRAKADVFAGLEVGQKDRRFATDAGGAQGVVEMISGRDVCHAERLLRIGDRINRPHRSSDRNLNGAGGSKDDGLAAWWADELQAYGHPIGR